MIPAWTVTSSAVVGSSAISSDGWHASAMAIAMRWRIPPENWCGYEMSARSGSGSRTSSSSSTARAWAAFLRRPRCDFRWSVIWRSIESIGCSDVIGSWKTIESRLPRVCRSERPLSLSRSVPSNVARPSTCAPRGSSRSSASVVIVLPLPLSPATPKISPGSTEKSTPSTIVIGPLSLGSLMVMFSTSRSAAISGSPGRADRRCRAGRRRRS